MEFLDYSFILFRHLNILTSVLVLPLPISLALTARQIDFKTLLYSKGFIVACQSNVHTT